jgi:trans-AT polyketide synthase, acyltransferase and oxidoreductase domains
VKPMSTASTATTPAWRPTTAQPVFSGDEFARAIHRVREPVHIVQSTETGHLGLGLGGEMRPASSQGESFRLLASLPPLYPEWLGDRGFTEVHGLRFPYVGGAMANGIATTDMVVALGQAGMLGFFGAAGLSFDRVERSIDELIERMTQSGGQWGANLIYSPHEPELEERVADLYIRRAVPNVSASAYMKLTPSIVRYALTGLSVDAQGQIQRRHNVFAKVSRTEVAEQFMGPAPSSIVDKLLAAGLITAEQAQLSAHVSVAEDVIVEADSGGHTDNRPMVTLFPEMIHCRQRVLEKNGFTRPVRLGAAGGLGTPASVASAFGLGAAFVLLGSVHQSCVESGLSDGGRALLAKASSTDVMMAPAADMFEMGVELQVLKRGTRFAPKARRLYDVYRTYSSLDDIPAALRAELEQKVLGESIETIWESTRSFWESRNPEQAARAEKDPHHKMALVFRWYLGLSSRWAIDGQSDRTMDYQIWCGPAMGSFNTWVKGTFLESPEDRQIVQIAKNVLEGAARITRAHQLRTYGLPVPERAFLYQPRPLN